MMRGAEAEAMEQYGPDAKEALIREIRDDLKKQAGLKQEILKEMKPAGLRETALEVSKHPVLLLVIGSLFGGWLSSSYQSREWNRQQEVLEERREYERQREKDELSHKQRVEQKIATRDQIMEAIININAASQSAVRPIFYEDAASFTAKDKDRTKEWDKAIADWQSAQIRVMQKAELYFAPAVAAKLKEITETATPNRNFIHVDVNNFLGEVRKKPAVLDDEQSPQYKDLKGRIRKNVLTPLSEIMVKSKQLMQLMQNEIQSDIAAK